ncbi:TPM domain-containing protein [Paracoccus ravus]|uniref:TPM domain-containing protein n=1 Tax=Paracoccus ravus TaxID=2447760 RepID=UPI00106DF4E7|nr:TPM domain-containing protein [Paracoccus ravus]
MRGLFVLLLGLTLWAQMALAQDLPKPRSVTVNDFAEVITPEDEAAIDRALQELRNTTGIEGTVVTLEDRARYGGSDGLEPFATRLFNQWGVGDASRNDGFMVLVLALDREARIELGAGYSPEADIRAQDIMRGTMLPAFRENRLSTGTRDGTEAVISLIARPQAQGLPPPKPRNNWADKAVKFMFFGAFTAIFAAIARRHWRRRHCPQCGKGKLVVERAPHHAPRPEGGYMIDETQITRSCPSCGWSETRSSPMPQRIWYDPSGEVLRRERNPAYRAASRSGGSGFGGGSSRGGGASGRW